MLTPISPMSCLSVTCSIQHQQSCVCWFCPTRPLTSEICWWNPPSSTEIYRTRKKLCALLVTHRGRLQYLEDLDHITVKFPNHLQSTPSKLKLKCTAASNDRYPDNPTRQQEKDVKELMGSLSQMYPCKECADHFKEVLRSHVEFSQWLCHVHNVVNRSLGKPRFPCERVDARWGKLDCVKNECDILGTTNFWRRLQTHQNL